MPCFELRSGAGAKEMRGAVARNSTNSGISPLLMLNALATPVLLLDF